MSTPAPTSPASWVRTLAAVALLSALGVAANARGLVIGYEVTFIFGSIFPVIAAALFGTAWGGAAALVASSYTFVLWNHPFAIVIFTSEVLWLGLARKRGARNLLLLDTAFWALAGLPMVYIFYHGVMHVDGQGTLIIALKQALNGVFNVLIASLLLQHFPLLRRLRAPADPGTSMEDLLFHLTAVLVMVPTLGIVLVENRRDVAEREQALVRSLAAETAGVQRQVDDWLTANLGAAGGLAAAGARSGFRPEAALQETTARVRAVFPDFHNMYVADASARTVAFDPPFNERGESTLGLDFSDRPYVSELRRSLSPVVSEVFLGRGGVFVPIFSISAPIVEDGRLLGYGLGAVNVARLGARLAPRGEGSIATTLVDGAGRIVASSSPARRPMESFLAPIEQRVDVGQGVVLHLPGAPKNVSLMKSWKGAYYEATAPIARTSWTLRVSAPVAPLQAALYENTIRSLLVVTALYVLALLLATVISRVLSAAPRRLADISRDLPARLDDGREPAWPESSVAEMRVLVDNFRHTATALRERMHTITEANELLGARVAERTRELEELTASLERRISEEIALRQRNEQMLFQQSKLAAMGEMIGAIAHQWRQPLNVLGLIVQNFADDIAERDASPAVRAEVAGLVGTVMAQVRLMSKTIEDFRGFFLPDREETEFDAMVAAGDVIALLSAQLASSHIGYRLVCHAHGRVVTDLDDVERCPDKIVRARRNELEHVLLNLVNNAREAILERRARDGGGGAISLEFSPSADALAIEVRDDGGGIKPELLDRVFEPYFTTKLQTGTGLGLYLAKVILEDHCRARLSVRNEGEGAVFRIELPRVPAR